MDEAYSNARRHSRRVRIVKVALPVLAVLLVAGFGVRTWLGSIGLPTFDLAATTIENGKLVMANPKLDGFTKVNQPYSMKADRATQDLQNTSVIGLENISARVPIGSSGAYADVRAAAGTYDNAKSTLVINNRITIDTSDGKSATLGSANVDIGSGSMSTQDPVDLVLDGSRVQAGSMAVSGHGERVLFGNGVKVIFEAAAMKKAEAQPGNENAVRQ